MHSLWGPARVAVLAAAVGAGDGAGAPVAELDLRGAMLKGKSVLGPAGQELWQVEADATRGATVTLAADGVLQFAGQVHGEAMATLAQPASVPPSGYVFETRFSLGPLQGSYAHLLFLSPRVAGTGSAPAYRISYRFVGPCAVANNSTGFYLVNTGDEAYLKDPLHGVPLAGARYRLAYDREYTARAEVTDVPGGVRLRFYLHDPLLSGDDDQPLFEYTDASPGPLAAVGGVRVQVGSGGLIYPASPVRFGGMRLYDARDRDAVRRQPPPPRAVVGRPAPPPSPTPPARTEVPNVFSENLVIQQGKPVRVWGRGVEGDEVTVSLAGRTAKGSVAGGRWRVELDPLPAATAAEGFVTRQGPTLRLDGREYRAIGVNMPDLHQTYFGTWFHIEPIFGTPEKAREAIVAGIEDASRSGLAFIRFFASPGYPRDQAMLYDRDPGRYWALMDELFGLCRQHHLRLVPSLGTIPGPYLHFGEKGRAILDPQSRTSAWVQRYVRQFVTRYRDDPTVLMWELVNEGMLHADVEMEGRKLLPAAVYPPGTQGIREQGSLDDSLNWVDYLKLYREHAALIRSLDPNHLVTSGDAQVRPECTSRRETFPHFTFRSDTWREWLANNLASQPEPLDVFSFHFYGNDALAEGNVPWKGMTTLQQMRGAARCVHAAEAPVFIGELGAAPNNQADPSGRWLGAAIDAMETEGVSLMALWVWHFPWQPELTMSSATYPEVVRRAAQFNRQHAGPAALGAP